MADLVLTLIGPDRPGLVEAVAEPIAAHGGNWLESRMAHLAGQFAGIVLYRRRADAVVWQRATRFPKLDALLLRDVVPDNEVFAVATVDAEGNESLPQHPSKLE